jgi:hypothetical protein
MPGGRRGRLKQTENLADNELHFPPVTFAYITAIERLKYAGSNVESIGGFGGKSPVGKGSLQSPRSHCRRTFLALARSVLMKEINAMRSGISRQMHHIRRPKAFGA